MSARWYRAGVQQHRNRFLPTITLLDVHDVPWPSTIRTLIRQTENSGDRAPSLVPALLSHRTCVSRMPATFFTRTEYFTCPAVFDPRTDRLKMHSDAGIRWPVRPLCISAIRAYVYTTAEERRARKDVHAGRWFWHDWRPETLDTPTSPRAFAYGRANPL